MRLQAMGLPHTVDKTVRRPHGLRHRTGPPVVASFGVVCVVASMIDLGAQFRLPPGVPATVIAAARTLLGNPFTRSVAKRFRTLH